MGSAETSGVVEKGFDTILDGAPCQKSSAITLSASAVLLIVATFLAGGCFIAYDTTRSFSDSQDRARLVATLAASHLESIKQATGRDATDSLPDLLPEDFHVAIADADGAIVYASSIEPQIARDDFLRASAPMAEASGQVSGQVKVFVPISAVIEDIAPRAAITLALLIALALAAALALGKIRARRDENRPDATTIEAIPYGLAHWREDGALVCANSAFARHLGLVPELVAPGTTYGEISSTIAGQITMRPVLDANRQRVIEIECEDGSTVMLDERPCPSGGFVTVVTDITDRKAADRMLGRIRQDQKLLARRYHEEKLKAEASSRAKTSFLAHLSHDIRTPLNHIIGFADMIRLETFGPLGDPKYKTYLEDIKHAGEQLLKSFGEILEFAQIEAGRKALKRERFTTSDLLDASAARFALRAQNAGVRLHVEKQHTGELLADRHYLDRMLANLLDNALRYTDRDGLVRLAAWVGDGSVVLEVTDTGAGMTEDQMGRLAQPFVLSDAAFARDHNGIGLGIAMARAIAEQSGGRLAIDSLPGIGTTVAISLPLAPALSGTTPAAMVHARAA